MGILAFHTRFSRVFHPCLLVPRFPLPRFQPLYFWCSRVFHSRVFSRPLLKFNMTKCINDFFFRDSFVSLKEKTIIKLHRKRMQYWNVSATNVLLEHFHDTMTTWYITSLKDRDKVESYLCVTTLSWPVDQACLSDVEGLICTVGDVDGRLQVHVDRITDRKRKTENNEPNGTEQQPIMATSLTIRTHTLHNAHEVYTLSVTDDQRPTRPTRPLKLQI